jgi:hypothetical protein
MRTELNTQEQAEDPLTHEEQLTVKLCENLSACNKCTPQASSLDPTFQHAMLMVHTLHDNATDQLDDAGAPHLRELKFGEHPEMQEALSQLLTVTLLNCLLANKKPFNLPE